MNNYKKSNALRYALIDRKMDLLTHEKNILDLFFRAYDRNLSIELWHWLYIDNPRGEPIVSLCYSADQLVGHFAVIPITLKLGDGLIKAAVACTTMVDAKYAAYGVFFKLVKMGLTKLRLENYQLVIGFPNKNSAPVMQVYFSWKIEKSYAAKLSKTQIKELVRNYEDSKILKLPNLEGDYLKWRLSKPGADYFSDGDNIFKHYNDDLELVYFTENSVEKLDDKLSYKVIVDEKSSQFLSAKVLDYNFGYLIFDKKINFLGVKKDLLMSDVF